jgi:putative transposase
MQVLTYKYRLLPTRRQHSALTDILEAQRQLYNAALGERIDAYRKCGITISEADQSKSLTQIRRDDPRFAAVQRRIQRETLRRLDRAYKAFFSRVKRGEVAGFPRFKGRDFFNGFGFDAFLQIKFDGKRLRFAGIPGGLRVHIDRPIDGTIKGIWFKRDGRRWYVGFQVEVPCGSTNARHSIGIDVGVAVLAATSRGEMINNPRVAKRIEKELRRRQRAISRCQKGSSGRKKSRAKLRAMLRKATNTRHNHIHKTTAIFAKQFRCVAVEKLTIRNMVKSAKGTVDKPGKNISQKSGLNRSIMDSGFGMFRQLLSYKCARNGVEFIEVDPRYTSQKCSSCGSIDKNSRKSQAEFTCTNCGFSLNADINAAKNIHKAAFGHTGGLVRGMHNVVGYGKRASENTAEKSAGQRGKLPFHPICGTQKIGANT